jgi:cobalt-zinc-cadmium efflux system protein
MRLSFRGCELYREGLLSEHNHNHVNFTATGNKLKYGIFLSLAILAAELVGGLLSHSLALLSDAGHVFADIIALGLSWYGIRQASRPSNSNMTFGYHRIGVVVAIINALTIFAVGLIIIFEAYHRFQKPPEINSLLMMTVAVVGLLANLLVTWWLRKEQKSNINIRSAFWHSIGDALASVGVIAGGLIIFLTGQVWVDPLVSVLISLVILTAAWSIFREGMRVILEATPKDVDVLAMIDTLKKIKGVVDVHDVHVWSISPEIRAMNGHILINDMVTSQAALIREEIEAAVREQYHIEHTTLQMECLGCECNDTFCNLQENHPEKKQNKT